MDMMNRPKDGFYAIQTCLWQKTPKKQKGGGSLMEWAGIVNQTIIGPFKVDKEVELYSANYCDFMDKTFVAWYKLQFYSDALSHVS